MHASSAHIEGLTQSLAEARGDQTGFGLRSCLARLNVFLGQREAPSSQTSTPPGSAGGDVVSC